MRITMALPITAMLKITGPNWPVCVKSSGRSVPRSSLPLPEPKVHWVVSRHRQPEDAQVNKVKPMKTFANLAELAACVGQDVAATEWVTITQQQVNQFAEATGDHQWIHVDVERAQQGPFGAPIAHGFLTLSLLSQFFDKTIVVTSARMGVNYGLNKVRFPAPVPVGSRVRARFTLQSCTPVAGGPRGQGGLQLVTIVTIELEGSAKPACVAEA